MAWPDNPDCPTTIGSPPLGSRCASSSPGRRPTPEEVGLTPQQHQALLSIKGGYPGRETISIGELARHLLIKNHSAVELVGRLVKAGLVTREPSSDDRRTICVQITAKGEQTLSQLSRASLDELATSAEAMRRLVGGFEQPKS